MGYHQALCGRGRQGGGRVNTRIPADVDMPDRIFAGLTARQLAILSCCGLLLWAMYMTFGKAIPLVIFGAIAAPVAAAGLVVATTTPGRVPLEKLFVLGLRHLMATNRRVLAPDGIPDVARWARRLTGKVAPIDTPLQGLDSAGVLDLGADGNAAVCESSSINFALRSEDEKTALIEGFERILNSLDSPVQFLVRSERADLHSMIATLERDAAFLPNPGLTAAAVEHASFLRLMASQEDTLRRRVLVCLRETRMDARGTSKLEHRIEETSSLLRGMGIRLDRLGAQEFLPLIRGAVDDSNAPGSGMGLLDEVVRGART